MQRFNIFNITHKGLRASLYHTAIYLQQVDFTDDTAGQKMVEQVQEVIMLIHHFEARKQQYIFPLVGLYDEGVESFLRDGSLLLHKSSTALDACLQQYQKASSVLEQLISGSKLNASFATFLISCLRHLERQESSSNPVLWRFQTDDELKSLSARIAETISPWMQEYFHKWILQAANPQERLNWEGQWKHGNRMQQLIQKAREELSREHLSLLLHQFKLETILN